MFLFSAEYACTRSDSVKGPVLKSPMWKQPVSDMKFVSDVKNDKIPDQLFDPIFKNLKN